MNSWNAMQFFCCCEKIVKLKVENTPGNWISSGKSANSSAKSAMTEDSISTSLKI